MNQFTDNWIQSKLTLKLRFYSKELQYEIDHPKKSHRQLNKHNSNLDTVSLIHISQMTHNGTHEDQHHPASRTSESDDDGDFWDVYGA